MHTTQEIVPRVFENIELRIITVSNETFWVGKDVCLALGLQNHRDALSSLDPDEVRESVIPTPSGNQTMKCVNESGLYHLIFKSRKPIAKEFRKWVTNVVLPSIRKTGDFTTTRYTLEPNGQLVMFPHNESHVRNEIQKQMIEVALSTRSTSVRKLLYLLKPIVFN